MEFDNLKKNKPEKPIAWEIKKKKPRIYNNFYMSGIKIKIWHQNPSYKK